MNWPMPKALRSFLAIVAGIVVLVGISIVLTLLVMLAMHMKPGPPTHAYLVANVVTTLLGAACGGLATAKLAPDRGLRHVAILATVILVLGARSYRGYHDAPHWYGLMMVLVPSLGTFVGPLLVSWTGRSRSA